MNRHVHAFVDSRKRDGSHDHPKSTTHYDTIQSSVTVYVVGRGNLLVLFSGRHTFSDTFNTTDRRKYTVSQRPHVTVFKNAVQLLNTLYSMVHKHNRSSTIWKMKYRNHSSESVRTATVQFCMDTSFWFIKLLWKFQLLGNIKYNYTVQFCRYFCTCGDERYTVLYTVFKGAFSKIFGHLSETSTFPCSTRKNTPSNWMRELFYPRRSHDNKPQSQLRTSLFFCVFWWLWTVLFLLCVFLQYSKVKLWGCVDMLVKEKILDNRGKKRGLAGAVDQFCMAPSRCVQ